MPCCLMLVAAMFPRLALIVMWLTGYGARAFDTVIWPLLGFIFMPFTACFYAIAINTWGELRGLGLLLLILGVILDLGSHSGGARTAQYQYVEYRRH